VLTDSYGNPLIPSLVAFNETGTQISVGEKARNQRKKLHDIKRIIGRKWDTDVEEIRRNFSYSIIRGDDNGVLIEVPSNNSSTPLKKKPEEILGELMKEVKLIAERNLTSFI